MKNTGKIAPVSEKWAVSLDLQSNTSLQTSSDADFVHSHNGYRHLLFMLTIS